MNTKKLFIITSLLLIGNLYSQSFNKVKLDSLFQLLELKDKYMGSIAISENGNLIYTNAVGKDDIENNKKSTILTKYRIGSISKTFTATLIFKAIEENKLTLNQTIDKYFPIIANAKKITIGNLLNHRSGIHNFTNDNDYLEYNTLPKTEEEMLAIIAKGKSDFEPNSKAEYSNSNFVLLSYILEKIYNRKYSEILLETIVKPLGLKNTYFGGKINLQNDECLSYSYSDKWEKEPETDMSIPMGAGGIVSNPTDLVIFIENLFNGKIISEKSLVQMKTIQDKYGMGLFKTPFYHKIGFGHTGGIDGFGSVLSYFPDHKLAIALTSNGVNYENNNIMIAALSCVFNKKFEIPTFKIIDLKTKDLDKYLGEYSNTTFPLAITIIKKDTKLFAKATGQSEFPLDATEKDTFEFSMAGIKLLFNVAEKQMTIIQAGMKNVLSKK